MRGFLPVVAGAVALVGLACQGDGAVWDQRTPREAEVIDSAGWRIVHSRAPKWQENEAWTVSSEPRLVVGVLNGPEEYQWVNVVAASRRSDGSFVVVDGESQSVRLFDSRGQFLKTLGGPGSGPGEFTNPRSILVLAGDTVVVWDEALLRVTRFDSEGELAGIKTVDWGQVATRLGTGMALKGVDLGVKGSEGVSDIFPGPMSPLADGGLLIRLVEKTGKTPPSGYHRLHSGALRLSGDLSVVDTLMFFGDTELISVDAPWGPFGIEPPLAKETRITHRGSPPKICIGDQEGPEIVCFHPDGGQTALRWESDPVPVTEAEVRAWREATAEAFSLKLSRDQIWEVLDQVPIPEVRPPYSTILLDPDGSLWVERGPTAGKVDASVDFMVFDPGGALQGVVALPPIQVMEIGLHYVLGVYRDELEIQYLHVYELKKDSAAQAFQGKLDAADHSPASQAAGFPGSG